MEKKLTKEQISQWVDLELEEFNVESFRRKHDIDAGSSTFYMTLKRMVEDRELKKIGRGVYRKVYRAKPVKILGRERRAKVILNPPIDYETKEPLDFFNDITLREGDLWLLSGFKNKGKTNMCINIVSENLDKHPTLMGNEYTIMGENGEYEPAPRFANRLDSMDWVQWLDDEGVERFDALPVYRDFAEQIDPGGFYVIDWINLPGEYYMISPVLEGIKQALGRGIAIVVLQKNPGSDYGRGGNPSKDFVDAEILLDPYGDDPYMTMLTVGTVKESKGAVMGRKFVYKIRNGVKITDFREVVKCSNCYGKGWRSNRPCDNCNKLGFIDKPLNV